MTNEEIQYFLTQNQDPQYREFHTRLSPQIEGITGVRVPVVRSLARKIVEEGADPFLQTFDFSSYEERLLYGLVIGALKQDFETVFVHIRKFTPQINSWGICDTFCAALKITKKHRPEMLEWIKTCLTSDAPYTKRFGIVLLLDYYITEEYTEEVLNLYDTIESESYYVNMAIAWGISVCFIKQREKTLNYLHRSRLNHFTLNKTAQKIRESLRVSPEDKAFVKTLFNRSI